MNKTTFKVLGLNFAIAAASLVYGFCIAKYQIFPFYEIRVLKFSITGGKPAPANSDRITFFETFSQPSDVVMVGDSLTDGANWADIFPNRRIANRGISGDTSSGVLARIGTIKSVKAKRAFILLGINDFGDGRGVDEVFHDYQAIVAALRSDGTVVYIQSTLYCDENKRVGWLPDGCAATNKKIADLNAKLHAYAATNHIQYIDLNAKLAGPAGLRDDLTLDGVHLNTKGYVTWKDQISGFI